MPTNLIGWERKIKAFCDDNSIVKGKSAIQRLALKIHERAAFMQHYDADDLLRSVLVYSDKTGEAAARNVDLSRNEEAA